MGEEDSVSTSRMLSYQEIWQLRKQAMRRGEGRNEQEIIGLEQLIVVAQR